MFYIVAMNPTIPNVEMTVRLEDKILIMTFTGEFTLKHALKGFLNLLEAAKQHKAGLILMDGRRITGTPKTLERYEFGEFISKEYLTFVQETRLHLKIGFVLTFPVFDPNRLGETVAVNRGMPVKVFNTIEDARTWLLNTSIMTAISKKLSYSLSNYSGALQELDDTVSGDRPAPGKWSRKEELGHLIDSAHNNLRRFIVGQLNDQPNIVYDQNGWVELNHYNALPVIQLVQLWLLLNQQMAHVWSFINDDDAQRMCNTGKEKKNLRTLQWLAEDYILHMHHHLHHILDLEPVAY